MTESKILDNDVANATMLAAAAVIKAADAVRDYYRHQDERADEAHKSLMEFREKELPVLLLKYEQEMAAHEASRAANEAAQQEKIAATATHEAHKETEDKMARQHLRMGHAQFVALLAQIRREHGEDVAAEIRRATDKMFPGEGQGR